MTQAEWEACTNPDAMITLARQPAGARKMRLFCAACCRRVWHLLRDPDSRDAVEAIELVADDKAGERQRQSASQQAHLACRDQEAARDQSWGTYEAAVAVTFAAADDSDLVGRTYSDEELAVLDEYWYWWYSHGTSHRCGEDAKFVSYHVATASCRARHGPAWQPYPEGAWGHLDLAQPEFVAELAEHAGLLRCIVGNPARPLPALPPALQTWRGGIIPRLAQAAYEQRHVPAGHLDATRLAVLTDALEEAGCEDALLLAHLRGPGPHVRGCAALDLLRGKA